MTDSSLHARFRVERPGFTLDVDLQLPGRGVTALFGPSGSGKTTCLRAIAGLERLPGYLRVNGEIWQNSERRFFVPPHQRPIGYVFQDANLFAHLTVRDNLNFGARRAGSAARKVDPKQIETLLDIGALADRKPATLSGGERQRVAIARALLTHPRLLLMDEPLAALDVRRKQEVLPYLERLHDELEIPVLYVSHAPDEVARLADHLVVLAEGRALASGPLSETLARLDLPTALGDDAGVVIDARIGQQDEPYGLTALDFPGGRVWVARFAQSTGRHIRFRVLARDVSITLERQHDTSILNLLAAKVVAQGPADTPAHVLVKLEAEGTPLLARITRRSFDQLQLAPGRDVWAQIKAVALLA